jgi:hypothetical protein
MGPAALLSINNKRYYLSIVDDFSKYTWCFPLLNKSDVTKSFLQFKLMVEKYLVSKFGMFKVTMKVNFNLSKLSSIQ